jgi:arylsulfatase A-like enzyme
MHGYVDKREETMGGAILHSPRVGAGKMGQRILVDVFPTLCDLLEVPVTEHNEGTSVLKAQTDTAEAHAWRA